MLYIVNKPTGISSNLVIKILKRVLKVSKIGFAGTLDPLASGLMIVGTDGSSKLFSYLDEYTKTYEVEFTLNGTSLSYDCEQDIISLEIDKNHIQTITEKYIRDVIQENFSGEIDQIPPSFSANWVDGVRAYDLARKGQEFTLNSKKRYIYDFEIVAYSWPKLTAKITVSHGTYIRAIARDLGTILDTGGYITKLKRTHIGHLGLGNHPWITHNDILYSSCTHRGIFPHIPLLTFSPEQTTHLERGSTPLETIEKDGYYFIQYNAGKYGLLEAKKGLIYPLKNQV